MEELEYRAEDGDSSQAWVPLRIIKPKHSKGRLPAVVYLHATGAPVHQVLTTMSVDVLRVPQIACSLCPRCKQAAMPDDVSFLWRDACLSV
jgi:hypothetical protein